MQSNPACLNHRQTLATVSANNNWALLNFCVMLDTFSSLAPAALNNINNSSTGLFRKPGETGNVSFFKSRYNPLISGQ